MSDFSVFLHKAAAWLEGSAGASPTLADASAKVSAAADAVEGALPTLATAAANAALAMVPGGLGTLFDPLADGLIDDICGLLQGKKSTAAPAQPAAEPQPGTVVN